MPEGTSESHLLHIAHDRDYQALGSGSSEANVDIVVEHLQGHSIIIVTPYSDS